MSETKTQAVKQEITVVKEKPEQPKPPTVKNTPPIKKVGAYSELGKLTRDREKLYKERVLKVTSILFNKQFSAAIGLQYMYKFELRYDKENSPYYSKPILVVSPDEIALGLTQIMKVGEGKPDPDGPNGDVYFNITSKDPDQRVIDSMLDRTFGKAKQQLDISSLGERIGGIAITEEREQEVENMFAIRRVERPTIVVEAEVVPQEVIKPANDTGKQSTNPKNNQGGPANA